MIITFVGTVFNALPACLLGLTGWSAPPWELVYISPNRLLMQGAYDQVIEAYGQMGLAVNSPQIMADHIGAELNFAALLEEKIRLGDENSREAAWKFRRNHLERRALALDTRNFLERGYT